MRKQLLNFNHLLMVITCLLLGYSGSSRAATVDDLKVLNHSYVLTCENLGARPGKGALFGDGYFLDVTGGSVATNKGAVDLSVVDTLGENGTPLYVTQDIVDKYSEYGSHLNYLRLKNAQDVIAMKVIAGSKLIFFIQGNNKTGTAARIPKIATDAQIANTLNAAPDADFPATVAGFRYEWTAEDGGLIYIGSYNGDMFVSYIIVEVPEAVGTPSVMVGEQTYENGLWLREVTCMPDMAYGMPTIVTYTTDGTEPTATSPVYTEPIKVYKDATLKFQAFMDQGTGGADESGLLPGADNEANVNFQFNAPIIDVDGATVIITSPYEGAENYILVNGDNEEKANSITLEESATITAYSKIINGDYAEFLTKSTSKDVYVLNPIKEKKTIKVISGDVVFDDEYGYGVYRVEKGAISADKMDFFVKNLTFAVVDDADYQIDDKEIYIKMSNTNITFQVAEGDSVNVKVVCSKNSCKNLYSDNATDRMCYVNVNGTTYCHMDADGNEAADQQVYPDANIIEFGLGSGYHTFQKYSGSGNIYIASIEITPEEKPSVFTATYEPYTAASWGNEKSIGFSLADVATALKTDTATLVAALNSWTAEGSTDANMFFLTTSEGLSDSYTQGSKGGFWVNVDGLPQIWSDENSGLRWFNSISWDANSDAFSIIIGLYPGQCAVGDTFKPKFILKLGNKEVVFEVTINIKAIPVVEIPEPELAWQKLTVVDYITKDVTQKPRSVYTSDKVEVDLTKALPKLGINAALVQNGLRQLLFAKNVYLTEGANIGAQMSDSLTNESSAGGIGFWMRNVCDAGGNPTFECGRFTFDGDDSFYAEAFAFDAETGILSCNIGQYPNNLKGGNTYYADIYIVYGEKAIKIRYNLNVKAGIVGTLDDYVKVGESTIKVEMEPANSYDAKDFSIDIETMANALGCEVGEIEDFYMLEGDINFAGKNQEAVGYWVSMEGGVVNWGENAMFYITPKADDYSTFGIGQYPGHMNIGDSVRVNLYFFANNKYYQLGVELNIVAGGKMGDVNHDDYIDVTDAVLIIDDILLKNPANYDASLADVNNDGYIDVTDVVMVIDAILGKIELSRGAEPIDRSAYTAFQMDLTIPAGYVLESVSLTDIAKNSHSLVYAMLPDGRCRVVVCSMNNEALPGAWDEVIGLNLRGKGDAQMTIDRAVFVTIDGERHELMMNPTSIAELSIFNSQLSTRYDLQGRKVEKNAKGVLIENGRKVVMK